MIPFNDGVDDVSYMQITTRIQITAAPFLAFIRYDETCQDLLGQKLICVKHKISQNRVIKVNQAKFRFNVSATASQRFFSVGINARIVFFKPLPLA